MKINPENLGILATAIVSIVGLIVSEVILNIEHKRLSENDEQAAGCRPNSHAGSVRYRSSAAILAAGSRSFPAPGSSFLDFLTLSK
jgi:hypothetical protein